MPGLFRFSHRSRPLELITPSQISAYLLAVYLYTQHGMVSYQILSHPHEHEQAVEAVQHHKKVFEHPPNLVTGDRGVHSPETEATLRAAGVKRVAIPAADKLSVERQALEHTRSFRRGYRWRADIEGRIANLRRDYGLCKSAYHEQDGMERWRGSGVIASNLLQIAQAQGIKKAKKRAD